MIKEIDDDLKTENINRPKRPQETSLYFHINDIMTFEKLY